MNYYESVVIDYLRADRRIFVNTQCLIQLNSAHNPDTSGPHWYCDAIAADFKAQTVFLCEISYQDNCSTLLRRLRDWGKHWPQVQAAVRRDSLVPPDWPFRVWLFVRADRTKLVRDALKKANLDCLGTRITSLEDVQPWRYCSWNREAPADTAEISASMPS